MDRDITRRDFVGSSLMGAGAALLTMAAPGCRPRPAASPDPVPTSPLLGMRVPDWGSYGGVGDYATSYGNTEEVIRAAHPLRTGMYRELAADQGSTGEVYDLVIVGGGFAGLAAALEFSRSASTAQSCLLLDNHPIFGGEAKRNEFDVDGVRLMGPQGSNGTAISPSGPIAEIHSILGIPTEYEWAEWDNARFKPLEFARDNYGYLLWGDNSDSVGYFFGDGAGGGQWARNIWWNGMEGAGYSEAVRRDLLAWRTNTERPYDGDDLRAWLDSMTLAHYLTEVLGHGPELLRFLDPILASGLGLGCDALSALRAFESGVPGFDGFAEPGRDDDRAKEPAGLEEMPWFSFPGGNTGLARYFVKHLFPQAIPGDDSLENVITGAVDFDALDRPGQALRMRLGSMVVHVRHEGDPAGASHVVVGYTRGGKLETVRARTVVMACGNWVNRYIVQDSPQELLAAWERMSYAPILSVNVALRHWRPLYELGVTAAHWDEGFGFSGNIRRPMRTGGWTAPLDPDRPTVFTMYTTFTNPELPVRQQGESGRLELLSTPYAEYERQVRTQMQRLFGMAGFDAANDIAGIVLNRWGHAFVVGEPGFHVSTADNTAPPDVIRRGFHRVRFGHSDLNGHQHWPGAVAEGQRAAREALDLLSG